MTVTLPELPTDVRANNARVAEILAHVDELVAEGRVLDAVDYLQPANRGLRDGRLEVRLIELRHAAVAVSSGRPGRDSWPPAYDDLWPDLEGLPEVEPHELTAEILGSAIHHHGAVIVRGLMDQATCDEMVHEIDDAIVARDANRGVLNSVETAPFYAPFESLPGFRRLEQHVRQWVSEGGGTLTFDSPRAAWRLLEVFEAGNLRGPITEYLGERPALTIDKCTLRRVPLHLSGADWHQDGRFFGEAMRTVNVWTAVTACGGDLPTPGLDLIPRRINEIVRTGEDGSIFYWTVGDELVQNEGMEVQRPLFNAGDALLFDEYLLHRTAIDPGMTHERYAIETWFFAPSAYPDRYPPILF